ncbi:hypothetical protein CAEBREN_20561 [Caenorhabditis brenneri]|uniref:Uncharacterized protein n=1 Tax=Caenorhabditis brenneri TaxID=135651 RepID=G0MNU2_CAEBE|nr:hypothetical protein CAEBREN_20561 [Caenorhabditis brenneri]
MLTPASNFLPHLKIDFKRIALFQRAKNEGDVKITPALLKKLEDVDSVDEVLSLPSTSAATEAPAMETPATVTSASETPAPETLATETTAASLPSPAVAVRKNPKRKLDEDLRLTTEQQDLKCSHCDCKSLRVVDPLRGDEQVILECMRSDCLATVKFTTQSVGTVVGKEPNSMPRSIYNALDRYYPDTFYTQAQENPEREEELRGIRNKKIQQHQSQMIFESSPRGIYIDVPGQNSKARFMN